jgi:tRNA threonylcarbamoyladenosine biosynthesis protein TsaB
MKRSEDTMILSIETATELCGAALVRNGECIAQRSVAEKNIHSERLMVLVDEILREVGVLPKGLRGVAISIGPGSFTGLRIGLSAAKGLAYAQSLPLIAVPTLDAIAVQAVRAGAAHAGDVVCALIDAKRDEAYYAFYEYRPAATANGNAGPAMQLRQMTPFSIASIDAIAEESKSFESENKRVVFAGDGTRKIARHAAGVQSAVVAEGVICDPAAVGLIAERRFAELSTENYAELEPAYIRDFVTTQPRVANQKAIP